MESASDSRFDPNYAMQMLLNVGYERSLESLLKNLVARAVARPDIAYAQVWLVDKADGCLHLAVDGGADPPKASGSASRIPVGTGVLGQVAATGRRIAQRKSDAGWERVADPAWLRRENIESFTVTPIIFKGEVLGVIVGYLRPEMLDESLPFAQVFGNYIGAAVANARAFEEIRLAGQRLEEANQTLERELAERKESERKLRESEQRYRRLVDTASEGIWEVDEQFVTTLVNRRMAEMLGYERKEMVGRNLGEFLFEDDQAEMSARIAARCQGLTERYEQRYRRKDGSTVWMYVSAASMFDAEHRFTGSFAMLTDITERKGAEEALRRLNRELRAISNCNQSLLRATDEQSLLQEICRIVCHEAGYRVAWVGYAEDDEAKSVRPVAWTGTEEETLANLGITWADTEHGRGPSGTAIRTGKTSCIEDYETDPRVAPWRESVLQHGFRSAIALPLKEENANAFGNLNIYSTRPSAFTPEEIRLLEELAGDLAFGIVTLRSQAARKRAEEALRESETRFRAFVDHAADALFIYDFDQGTIVEVNRQACESLGYTRQELIGTTAAAFHLDSERAQMESVAQRAAAGESMFDTHWHRRKDGTVFPVEAHTSQYWYGGRRFLLKVARDITDRKRAEAALRAQANLLNLAHDAIFVADMGGVIKYWNRGAEERYGWNADQTLGRVVHELLKTVFPKPREEIMAEVTLTGRWEGELVHTKKDGTQAVVASRWSLQRDEQNAPVAILETNNDITERKRAEDALRRSGAYLAEGQRLAHMGSWAWSPATLQSLYWSEEMFQIYGLNPQEGVPTAEAFWQRIHPEDIERTRELLLKAAVANRDYEHDHRIVLPDGTVKHIHAIGHPVLDENGQVAEYVGTAMDVTERKQAEDELRKHRENLEDMVKQRTQELAVLNQLVYGSLESGEVGALWIDFKESDTLHALDNTAGMLGLEPDPTGEKTYELSSWTNLLADTAVAFPDYAPIIEEARERLLGAISGKYKNYRAVYPLAMPDGSLKWIDARAEIAKRDDFGQALLMTGTLIDITKLKQAEADLAEAKARAEAANRAKSTFLANMSHELRTPLNAVLGFSRLLKNGPDVTRQQQETLDIIVRSGEHLLNLINNVLDMAKIESGRVALKESEVDLNQLLHEMQSLMGVAAVERGLRFALESDPDLPRFVAVDAGKLRQVLLNLLGNAIKYTDSGGVKLRARPASIHGSEKAKVRFEVEDSGPGIGQEDCDRIFFPFVQLGDQAPAQAGTGLGLAICKQYVDLMGGQIGVTSKPGKGSVFYFEIPVRVLPSVAERDDVKHPRIMGLADGQTRYRLLIVEDQPENRLLLRRLLEPLGFELREAANGQEAVALFEQWHPDLIWMDIRMPVMDGLEAVRRIRATKASADTKIIALTAHALEEEREPIMAAGCDDLVSKPIREQDLFGALARHLGLKFIYEKTSRHESTPEAPELILNPEQLDALPAQLLQELRQAVIELDTARTRTLIEQVTERDASLGRALNTLAEQLGYKRLLKLLKKEKTL